MSSANSPLSFDESPLNVLVFKTSFSELIAVTKLCKFVVADDVSTDAVKLAVVLVVAARLTV